jgi:hypothetical protein
MGRLSIPSLIAASLTGLLSGSAPAADPAGDAQELLAKYTDLLQGLKAEIAQALPAVDEQKKSALQKAREAVKKAAAEANAAGEAAGRIDKAKEGLGIWRKYSVPDATQRIAEAKEQLKTAIPEEARKAAQQTLAAQEKRLAALHANIKEAEAEVNKPRAEQDRLNQAKLAAQKALAQAQADELAAAKALLADVDPFLGDKLDATLVKGALLSQATPQGLAEFARQGQEQEALAEKLLADNALMKQMLEAGGARFGKYGRAMEIITAIQKASPKANAGLFQRLALATGLEHAVPVEQSNRKDQTGAPATVDPVKRYLHYEKAFLDGELDPAFKDFSVWEYRWVVGCDAPDEILAWGREMLRNYRPDHVTNPDYGWRYSGAVRTEVRYGSQNVKDDLPSLHNYQNIIKNGGVCGRRAFFGRFILRSFGIPTWGVTQHAHAALSHWTPKGWLVNLGAGYPHSWWDKDEAPRSGVDFLLETQARAVPQDYLKVLRAQWISRVLGEQAYNDRKRVDGGFWSSLAHYQARAIAAAARAVELGPVGQELAEANESKETRDAEQAKLAEQVKGSEEDRKIVTAQGGTIVIPAVAWSNTPAGSFAPAKSFLGGMQLHCSGGFKADYEVQAPKAGAYALAMRVVTVQEGQKFLVQANGDKAPVEISVPYTCGLWKQTRPVELSLVSGKNVLHVAVQDGSRGVSIKDFTLTPVK